MLHCSGGSDFIRNMGNCQRVRQLRARGQILGPKYLGYLPLLRGCLVLQRFDEYRH